MNDVEIRHICDLYNEELAKTNQKYQGKDFEYNPHLDHLLQVALTQGQDAARDLLHKETIENVIDRIVKEEEEKKEKRKSKLLFKFSPEQVEILKQAADKAEYTHLLKLTT